MESKDFKITEEEFLIWLKIYIGDKCEGYSVTRAELNKLKAVIEEYLRKNE